MGRLPGWLRPALQASIPALPLSLGILLKLKWIVCPPPPNCLLPVLPMQNVGDFWHCHGLSSCHCGFQVKAGEGLSL